jgi:hypothetical protein
MPSWSLIPAHWASWTPSTPWAHWIGLATRVVGPTTGHASLLSTLLGIMVAAAIFGWLETRRRLR